MVDVASFWDKLKVGQEVDNLWRRECSFEGAKIEIGEELVLEKVQSRIGQLYQVQY